ncbi:MAG: hypothetical protein V4556_04560 [Bacteroidota bacterium]
MAKKTARTKQYFLNKNLEKANKGGNKKAKPVLIHPPTKKETDEGLSDGSAGAFGATENVQKDEE